MGASFQENGAPRSDIEHNGSHFCRKGCQVKNDTRVQFSPVPFHRLILPCKYQYAHETTIPTLDSKRCARPAHQTTSIPTLDLPRRKGECKGAETRQLSQTHHKTGQLGPGGTQGSPRKQSKRHLCVLLMFRKTCKFSSMLPQSPSKVVVSKKGRTQRVLMFWLETRPHAPRVAAWSAHSPRFAHDYRYAAWWVIRSLTWAWSNIC